jgi:hypothetical protein
MQQFKAQNAPIRQMERDTVSWTKNKEKNI